ncbi:hypothetical protein EDC04DRAFT_2797632 [Pisolithus marmoratus]|nr:hypothetical protein EDC04DRAFT_2797632 [Pisolithus marmoratus]
MSAPLPFHVDYLRTAAIFGHQDSVQSTASHHGMSLAPYYFSYAEFAAVSPAHLISPVVLGQVNQGSPLYSTSSQPYLPPFGDDANATPTLHGSGGTPATAAMASFPLEASQIHPLPPQFTNSVTEEPPNVPSRSSGDLKRCEWKNSQGDVCGTLVSRHCQEHLASAHGIFKMSSVTPVKCGACDEKMKRKSFLRHFRERHLGFRRQ